MSWQVLRLSFLWAKVLPTSIVVGVSTLGPVGQRLPAPGTWGTLAGLILYAVVFYSLHPVFAVLLNGVFIYLAMAFADEAEERLMMRDPGRIIVDEVVAVPLCFVGLGGVGGSIYLLGGWPVLLAGFLLFRLYDITKPWVIGRVQRLPGGIGCVMDDVLAALATCVTLHVAIAIWGLWWV